MLNLQSVPHSRISYGTGYKNIYCSKTQTCLYSEWGNGRSHFLSVRVKLTVQYRKVQRTSLEKIIKKEIKYTVS